jgi:hypothetical protein
MLASAPVICVALAETAPFRILCTGGEMVPSKLIFVMLPPLKYLGSEDSAGNRACIATSLKLLIWEGSVNICIRFIAPVTQGCIEV